ncbi:hypothetical protein ACFE04_000222 [Oxalis oulophora]
MTSKRNVISYSDFQMPLHYPKYTKKDYENMEEWKLDVLLAQYGLFPQGDLECKRDFAMGAFLWPDNNHHDDDVSSFSDFDCGGDIINKKKGPADFLTQLINNFICFVKIHYIN